ncbi:hemerythrin domain-containing protein [Kitasatospora sp. NPDC048365]|uniref:hemerythrin domain-containing protein n=1 Tax=Kitasatospora sp. NPDC048365 TaxID=3364050 RepID=UPI0037160FA8
MTGESIQTPDRNDGLDLVEQLLDDHDRLRTRFSALGGMPLGDPRRRELAAEVAADLAKHLEAEDQLLYPLLRRRMPRGDTTVDDALEEHAAIRSLIRELGPVRVAAAGGGTADFDRMLARLVEEATGHFGHEEANLLPALREDVSANTLAVLGERARAVEAAAPPLPGPQPPAALPPDRLLPPERPFKEKLLGSDSV